MKYWKADRTINLAAENGNLVFPVLIVVDQDFINDIKIPGFHLHHALDFVNILSGSLELKYLPLLQAMDEILEIRADCYMRATCE